MAVTPFFLPYRDDPRFVALCQKLNVQVAISAREAMSDKPSFFAELKRRNVYKVAVAYVVVAWPLLQGTAQVFPVFDIPNWAFALVVLSSSSAFRSR